MNRALTRIFHKFFARRGEVSQERKVSLERIAVVRDRRYSLSTICGWREICELSCVMVLLLAFAPAALADELPKSKAGEFLGFFTKSAIHGSLKDQVEGLRQGFKEFPYKGLVIRATWQQLEPEKGRLDWDGVDALVALAREQGGFFTFELFSGWYTPEWVYANGAKSYDSIDPHPARATYGQVRKMPFPWDPKFKECWQHVVSELAGRYQGAFLRR